MVLNEGEFEGKRYLSAESVKLMTSKQTGPDVKDGYGLGWAVGGDTFGHGGAFATDMMIDKRRGLIEVYLVQHAGFPKNGGEGIGAFRKAADAFAPVRR
jgi:CubicO group peptidase (beta-lactamase class C family)